MLTRRAFSPFAQAEAPSLVGLLRTAVEVALMVGTSTVAGLAMAPRWGASAIDLLYLPPVLGAAILFGLRAGLGSAILSALAYNYFFTAPIHTLRIDRPADLVTVAILFLVALVTSQLAARMRSQARIASANATRNATIAGFSRRLLSCSMPEEIGTAACREIAQLFDCNAALLGPGAPPAIIARVPPDSPLTPSDLATAAWVLEYGEVAGRGAARLDPAEWLFHPVKTDAATLAAMGLARDDGRPVVAEEHLPLLLSLLDQLALALARASLEAEMRDIAALKERDRLRSALLSSVGHDLRTPLTAIIAVADALSSGARDPALIATLGVEAAKLERYISNLLDMARIEAGTIHLKSEPIDLVDGVSAALRDLRPNLSGHRVHVNIPEGLPLVRADPQLLHHILINILDNAARYSGAAARIDISARRDGRGIRLSITDDGPGLPNAGEPGLDTFALIAGSDRKGGTGLGLAIVKGFAEAMGIGAALRNRASAPGAEFALVFPVGLAIEEAATDAGAGA